MKRQARCKTSANRISGYVRFSEQQIAGPDPDLRCPATRSCRKGFRSLVTTREGHHLRRRHARTRSSPRLLQPGLGRQRRRSPRAICFQPDGELLHLRHRQILNRGFNFTNSAHDREASIASLKTSTIFLAALGSSRRVRAGASLPQALEEERCGGLISVIKATVLRL